MINKYKHTFTSQPGYHSSSSRHPIRRRFLGIFLSVCLIAAAMPIEYYSFPVQAAWDSPEILSFPDLPEEVQTQAAAVGTPIEELNLPDTLEAICRTREELPSIEEDFLSDKAVSTDESSLTDENTPENDASNVSDTSFTDEPLPTDETEPFDITTEILTISGVTWASAPTYEDSKPGIYTFTPNLPEGYALSQEAEIPRITVTLTEDINGENDSSEEDDGSYSGDHSSEEDDENYSGDHSNSDPENNSEDSSESDSDSILPESGKDTSQAPEENEGTSQAPEENEDTGYSSDNNADTEHASDKNEDTENLSDKDADKSENKSDAPMRRKITAFTAGNRAVTAAEIPEADGPVTVEIPYQQTGEIIIDRDTIWSDHNSNLSTYNTLNAEKITFQNNATLTINNVIFFEKTLQNITISGNGTIKRAQANAYLAFKSQSLTISDITFDGDLVPASAPMLAVTSGTLQMNRCKFQNCNFTASQYKSGYPSSNTMQEKKPASALYLDNVNNQTTPDTALINNLEIQSCTGQQAIYTYRCSFTVSGGSFQNNSPCSMYITTTKCYLSDCNFINAGDTEGAIYFSEYSLNAANKNLPHPNTELHLKNIYFQGNTHAPGSGNDNAHQPPYSVYRNGAGALFYSTSNYLDHPILEFDNVRFCGDSTNTGTDGFLMYNYYESHPPKITVSAPLTSPIDLSLFARKDTVIAVGTSSYQLTQSDVKKLNLINLNKQTSDQTWFPVLDTVNNRIYLDSKDPGYDYSLLYNSNGASGVVLDDTLYSPGKTAIVKPADGLTQNGYDFICWNTEPDRSGTDYNPGDSLEMTKDTILYAIFQEQGKQTFTAVFYSGDPWQKTTLSTTVSIPPGESADTVSGTVTAPQLEQLGTFHSWSHYGWSTNPSSHDIAVKPGFDISLTKPVTIFYGVYQKKTTLSHRAPGTDMENINETAYRYAYAYKSITYEPATFTVREAPTAPEGYTFEAWHLDKKTYQSGDIVKISNDSVITAQYSKPVTANFFYGEKIQKYQKPGTLYNTKKGFTFALSFSFGNFPGWIFVGFDRSNSSYEGPLQSGPNLVTIEGDTDFYSVYKKNVTLSYYAGTGTSSPPSETKEARANVHEPEISYQMAEFTLAEGPSPPGCVFLGWNTQSDGKGTMYSANQNLELKENLKLYAIYEVREIYFSADFYSGNAREKETVTVAADVNAASGTLHTPGLKKFDGFEPLGWGTPDFLYHVKVKAGEAVTLSKKGIYYGIYKKDITMRYDANEGTGAPNDRTQQCIAMVTDQEIKYSRPVFSINSYGLQRPGYTFTAWNTKPDGSGTTYTTSDTLKLQEDLTLYAIWQQNGSAHYRVEHYLQNESGSGYTLVSNDTENLQGIIGTTVTAAPKKYPGYTEYTSHPNWKASGVVPEAGSLVLKLYYNRIPYQISFDLNGGFGELPETQTLNGGELLSEVAAPARTGYSFKGWYQDADGTAGLQWDFGKAVEENTDQQEVTLYAKWVDEIPPVLGEAVFAPGYKTLFHWIIQKRGLTITIPITEEGSGIGQAQYFLTPSSGTEITKDAEVSEAEFPDESAPQKLRVRRQHGQYVAQITIDEDFKGAVSILCTDRAGNVSARKLLAAGENGIITEDNAPEIKFSTQGGGLTNDITTVNIVVTDDDDNRIVSGIAGISYRIDDGEAVLLPSELFEKEIVNSHSFSVDISDLSEHTLSVTATDNAGNVNTQQITISHKEPPKEPDDDTPVSPPPDNPNANPDNPDTNHPDDPGPDTSAPGNPPPNLPEGSKPDLGAPDNSIPNNGNPDNSIPSLWTNASGQPAVSYPETQIGNPASREFQELPFHREPQTGEFTHVEIYATLSMIAGFTYLLLYFTENGTMTEEKKELLVSRLILWAQRGGKLRKITALAVIFLLLAYYHSIGRQSDALEAKSYVNLVGRMHKMKSKKG